MDNVMIIRIVAGFMFLGVLAVGIVYIAYLSSVLSKCSPPSRTMEPGMVWLLLIPLFNIIWGFLVVLALAKSLANEFRLRNIPLDTPEPGKSVGLAMCICGAFGIIPFVNIATGLAGFVLWILYWVKIAGYSHMLDLALFTAPPPMPPAPIS